MHEDGQAETRICQFDNLLLHKKQLLYLYSGIYCADVLCLLSKQAHNWICQVLCAVYVCDSTQNDQGVVNSMAVWR